MGLTLYKLLETQPKEFLDYKKMFHEKNIDDLKKYGPVDYPILSRDEEKMALRKLYQQSEDHCLLWYKKNCYAYALFVHKNENNTPRFFIKSMKFNEEDDGDGDVEYDDLKSFTVRGAVDRFFEHLDWMNDKGM